MKRKLGITVQQVRITCAEMGHDGKNIELPFGVKFTMHRDNNPLAYVSESKSGWLKSDGLVNLHCLILILNTEQVSCIKQWML